MSRILISINIIAILILLFAGFDQLFNLGLLKTLGLSLVIFTAAIFLLITTFLQLTSKDNG